MQGLYVYHVKETGHKTEFISCMQNFILNQPFSHHKLKSLLPPLQGNVERFLASILPSSPHLMVSILFKQIFRLSITRNTSLIETQETSSCHGKVLAPC